MRLKCVCACSWACTRLYDVLVFLFSFRFLKLLVAVCDIVSCDLSSASKRIWSHAAYSTMAMNTVNRKRCRAMNTPKIFWSSDHATGNCFRMRNTMKKIFSTNLIINVFMKFACMPIALKMSRIRWKGEIDGTCWCVVANRINKSTAISVSKVANIGCSVRCPWLET